MNETILGSNLAHELLDNISVNTMTSFLKELTYDYQLYINDCINRINDVMNSIPNEWNIPKDLVLKKLLQLSDKNWISECWNCFLDYLQEYKYV